VWPRGLSVESGAKTDCGAEPQGWTDNREPRRDDFSEPEKECPRREWYKHVRASNDLGPMR